MTIEAFPLQWPFGRPRISHSKRSAFKTDHVNAGNFVLHEIRLLGGSEPVISTNIPLRKDRLPYANYKTPDDKGVAVYFTYKRRQMCFACDKWDRVYDNIYAIGKTIEALRGIERWGTGDMVEQAFTGFVALASPKSPHEILGVHPNATLEEIEAAFRQKAKELHPDKGGDAAKMSELTEARNSMKAAIYEKRKFA